MGFCCRLGDEYQLKKNILYESTNFFVVPSIGQMGIKGYVLLCSKEHYFGMGNIPEEQISELETVLDRVKKIISDKQSRINKMMGILLIYKNVSTIFLNLK